jgi:hypothetical protein
MAETTTISLPQADARVAGAEAMRRQIIALIEDKRLGLRGFAENKLTTELKTLVDEISKLPVDPRV